MQKKLRRHCGCFPERQNGATKLISEKLYHINGIFLRHDERNSTDKIGHIVSCKNLHSNDRNTDKTQWNMVVSFLFLQNSTYSFQQQHRSVGNKRVGTKCLRFCFWYCTPSDLPKLNHIARISKPISRRRSPYLRLQNISNHCNHWRLAARRGCACMRRFIYKLALDG